MFAGSSHICSFCLFVSWDTLVKWLPVNLLIIVVVVSEMYMCIYSVFVFSEEVERCQKWSDNITQQIDLAFNIFFMVYFFIRVSLFFLQVMILFSIRDYSVSWSPHIFQSANSNMECNIDSKIWWARIHLKWSTIAYFSYLCVLVASILSMLPMSL